MGCRTGERDIVADIVAECWLAFVAIGGRTVTWNQKNENTPVRWGRLLFSWPLFSADISFHEFHEISMPVLYCTTVLY